MSNVPTNPNPVFRDGLLKAHLDVGSTRPVIASLTKESANLLNYQCACSTLRPTHLAIRAFLVQSLKFTATLRSPIIARGYLTFDALLGALLFDRLGDPEKAHAAIPLACNDGLFHASAAIFEPTTSWIVSFAASLRARHDLSPDLFKTNRAGTRIYRTMGERRRRDFGNVLSSYPAVETRIVTWHCIGDLDAIADLLRDADFIGKKRTAGFGQVAEWDYSDSDLDGLTDADMMPLRPIPVEMFEGDRSLPIYDAAWKPAYWDPANRAPCYAPPLLQH